MQSQKFKKRSISLNKLKWDLSWEIQQSAPAYKPGYKDCKLCIAEKYYILNEVDSVSLNVRSELLSKCRHKAKWKLTEEALILTPTHKKP